MDDTKEISREPKKRNYFLEHLPALIVGILLATNIILGYQVWRKTTQNTQNVQAIVDFINKNTVK